MIRAAFLADAVTIKEERGNKTTDPRGYIPVSFSSRLNREGTRKMQAALKILSRAQMEHFPCKCHINATEGDMSAHIKLCVLQLQR